MVKFLVTLECAGFCDSSRFVRSGVCRYSGGFVDPVRFFIVDVRCADCVVFRGSCGWDLVFCFGGPDADSDLWLVCWSECRVYF